MSASTKKPAGLKNLILVGAIWNGFANVARQLLGLASIILIARLLSPGDYGIAAASAMVIELVGVFSGIGAAHFILTRATVNNDELNTAWTLRVLVRVLCASVVFLGSAQIASLLRIPELESVLKVTAVIPVLIGLQNPGLMLTMRNLNYRAISSLDVISRLAGLAVGVTVAVTYRSYWAIVANAVTATLVYTVASYFVDTRMPVVTLKDWRNMLFFARWNLPIRIVGHYRGKIDNYLVARYFGAVELGIYSLAKRLATLPHEILVSTLKSIVLSALGGSQERKRNAVENLSLIMTCTLSVVFPVAAGLSMLADFLVMVILGQQWLSAIPIIEMLVILSVAFAATASISPALVATERIRTAFYMDLITTLIVLIAMLVGVFFVEDILTFALLRVLVAAIVLIFLCCVLQIVVGVRVLTIVHGLIPAMLSTVFMMVVIKLLRISVELPSPLLSLLGLSLIAFVSYIVLFSALVRFMRKGSIEIKFMHSLVVSASNSFKNKIIGRLTNNTRKKT